MHLRKRIKLLLLLCTLSLAVNGQLYHGEYFFDTDPGVGNGTPISFSADDSVNLNLNIPIAALSNGFHQLYIRFLDVNENWGIPERRPFLISPIFSQQPGKIKYAEYFIDTDPGSSVGTVIPVGAEVDSVNMNLIIPLTGVSAGFHKLYIRYADVNKKWGIPESRPFVVTSSTFNPQPGKIKYAEYFFNTDPGNGAGTPITIAAEADSVDMVVNAPIAGNPPGFHEFYIRFADINYKWSIPERRSFFINKYTFLGNGNWTTPANWANSLVPSNIIAAADEVLINPAPGGQCTYSGNISVLSGGKLEVQAGKILNVSGDFANDGQLAGTGTVNMNGAGVANLSSSGTVTATLRLTNKAVQLSGDVTSSAITLLSGSSITLGNYDLNMGSAPLTVATNTFIVTDGSGTLNRSVGATPVTFPVGINNTSYSPVTITNTGTADTFGVRVVQGVLSSGLTPVPVTNGNVNVSWKIEEAVPGGSNSNLTLQWRLDDEQPGFNRSSSFVSQLLVCPPPTNCEGSFYSSSSRGPASGTNPFTQTISNVTNLDSASFIITSTDVAYRFVNTTGNGNWNDPLNWTNERIPPNTITTGMDVTIDPLVGNECVFIGVLNVMPGAKITVVSGKKLTVRPN